jgi:hypothetical protein
MLCVKEVIAPPAMGKLTSAERGHAAMFGTEVALLATDLNCWHFPAALWRIVDLALYQTGLAKPHTKGRHPLVHVEQPHCSLHIVLEDLSGHSQSKKHTVCGDWSRILSPSHPRQRVLDLDIRE